MVGQTILGYHVDEKIGSGGFGTVYKVSKSNAAGTYVRALKHITLPNKKQYASILQSMGGDYSKADDYFAQILRDIVGEIGILSMLSESGIQNIVRYYENDIIETSSPKAYDIYILMEYLTPFPDYLERTPFTVRDVIRLGKDILRALIACHEKNIIHRDIKDDNIFVSAQGDYKLGDFGVSKELKDRSRAASVKGTPNYIAPEVYLGRGEYDSTVDVYSLGIVLYRLLNKSRNPFMPVYPAPYTSQDEDAAFEARMRGQIPGVPVCANNELGNVILKAIMPRDSRYNSAGEFLTALEAVEGQLEESYLSEDLGLSLPIPTGGKTATSGANQTMGATVSSQSNATIGSDPLQFNKPQENNTDRHLFDTVANQTPVPTPAPTPVPTPTPAKIDWKPEPVPTPTPVAPPQVSAVSGKDFRWLVYLSPVVIGLIWVIVYLVVIPATYGRAVSTIEWLIQNPTEIIEALKDSNTVLIPMYRVVLMKVFNWLTMAGLIVSLFFVGRTIQKKKPKTDSNALLKGKEAYLAAMDIYEQIRQINGATEAKKAVQSVYERLKNESSFGEGSDSVIQCENEIAACLDLMRRAIPGLENGETAAESTKAITTAAQRCLNRLKYRIELKKK